MKKCKIAEEGKCAWAMISPHGYCGYRNNMNEEDDCPELIEYWDNFDGEIKENKGGN